MHKKNRNINKYFESPLFNLIKDVINNNNAKYVNGTNNLRNKKELNTYRVSTKPRKSLIYLKHIQKTKMLVLKKK